MSATKGRYFALSPARKMIWDILDASMGIPLVSASRLMNVRDLMHARSAASPRPSWNAIFTKAYAKVAAETPELRRLFIRWPWGRLYEHPFNIGSVSVELDVAGEKIVAIAQVRCPEALDLLTLGQKIAAVKDAPEKSKAFRRMNLIARLPRFLRRFLWWTALEWSGPRRARALGTFGVTSVSFVGADVDTALTPLGNGIHYGPVDAAGNVRVHLVMDHRVIDGGTAGRALQRMETVLNSDLLAELRGLQALAVA